MLKKEKEKENFNFEISEKVVRDRFLHRRKNCLQKRTKIIISKTLRSETDVSEEGFTK